MLEVTQNMECLSNWKQLVLQLIVDSIKGAKEYGKDSELYAAIGYVTRSARQSGWIRKKAQPETALVK